MNRILITEPEYFDDKSRDILKQCGSLTCKRMNREQLKKNIGKFDAILVRIETKLDADMLSLAPRLRIIGTATVGLNHIDLDYAKHHGISVVSLESTNTIPASEYTFALIMGLSRNIPAAHESTKRGKWSRHRFIGTQLRGKTLGIVGLGKVGKEVASFAKAFGMNVIAYDPYIRSDIVRMVSLDELLKDSDVITIHTVLNSETRNMINIDKLNMMKPNALLINTARSGIVNTVDLTNALSHGVIRGAAFDVFESEPSDSKDPLISYARKHDNLIVTPHIGASTREAVDESAVEIAMKVSSMLSKSDK